MRITDAGHAGDCRAVLSCGGVAEALTADHRPDRLSEQRRITQQAYQPSP